MNAQMRQQTDKTSYEHRDDEAGRSAVVLAIVAAAMAVTIVVLLLLASARQSPVNAWRLSSDLALVSTAEAVTSSPRPILDPAVRPPGSVQTRAAVPNGPALGLRAPPKIFAWPMPLDPPASVPLAGAGGLQLPTIASSQLATDGVAPQLPLALANVLPPQGQWKPTGAGEPTPYPVAPPQSSRLGFSEGPQRWAVPMGSRLDSVSRTAADAALMVALAEAQLASGHLDVTITSSNGSLTAATIDFSRGSAKTLPGFHATISYPGASHSRLMERIVIGERSWERWLGNTWAETKITQTGLSEIGTYLPPPAPVTDVVYLQGSRPALEWHDPGRDTDITLYFDPATGVPFEMRQLGLATGLLIDVKYSKWNRPVAIAPPDTWRSL